MFSVPYQAHAQEMVSPEDLRFQRGTTAAEDKHCDTLSELGMEITKNNDLATKPFNLTLCEIHQVVFANCQMLVDDMDFMEKDNEQLRKHKSPDLEDFITYQEKVWEAYNKFYQTNCSALTS